MSEQQIVQLLRELISEQKKTNKSLSEVEFLLQAVESNTSQ
ncbi:hypothetical protein [Cryobacterium psychrophilum]|nr:hypothetical protein [Cryobacterium psychrophilum]